MTKPLDTNFIPSKENQFILYRSFLNLEEGKKMEALLEQNNIPHLLDIPRVSLSPGIIGTGMNVKATLKVLAQDFKRIDKMIADEIRKIPFSELKEHPLQECSEEDLYEILLKPEEWNIENRTMAQIILTNRGKDISEEEVERIKTERLHQIRKGKEGSIRFMLFFLICLTYSLFTNTIPLSILFGMAMGAYYLYSKKHDMDGNSYYEYEATTRLYGKVILIGSTAIFLVKLALRFY
jgi:hypothetical protein